MASEVTVIKPEQINLATIAVSTHLVACDGGGGPLGHPMTYYEIGSEGTATCNYCDRKFVLTPTTDGAHG